MNSFQELVAVANTTWNEMIRRNPWKYKVYCVLLWLVMTCRTSNKPFWETECHKQKQISTDEVKSECSILCVEKSAKFDYRTKRFRKAHWLKKLSISLSKCQENTYIFYLILCWCVLFMMILFFYLIRRVFFSFRSHHSHLIPAYMRQQWQLFSAPPLENAKCKQIFQTAHRGKKHRSLNERLKKKNW